MNTPNIIALLNQLRSSAFSNTSNNLQKEANNNFRRSSLAGNLNKYASSLNKLKEETEPKIKIISSKASIAYCEILQKIDDFDCTNNTLMIHNARHYEILSHIVNKLVILWYQNFSHKIGINCSDMLLENMKDILHINPEQIEKARDDTRFDIGISNLKSILDSVSPQNRKVVSSAKSDPKRFKSLLSSYITRIDSSIKFYDEVVKVAMPIFNDVRAMNEEFENNYNFIEKQIKDNELEEFKISESPELYNALFEYKACMYLLKNFYLFEHGILLEAEHLKLNQVIEIMFCLFLLKNYGFWGDPEICPV